MTTIRADIRKQPQERPPHPPRPPSIEKLPSSPAETPRVLVRGPAAIPILIGKDDVHGFEQAFWADGGQ